MKTLLILRHAKSSWANAFLDDFDRPLNKRGKRDAPRMGKLLVELDLVPDLIITSGAKRARSTAKRLVKACDYDGLVVKTNDLYLSGTTAYLRHLQQAPGDATTVMVIGHNPDMESLIEALSGEYERMPTAALAQINLAIDAWPALTFSREHELVQVWRPKTLDASSIG